MEVQNHPNTDEVNVDKTPVSVVAEPGGRYPIRMLHYLNGMMVIGFVIAVFPETTMLLRPHVVEVSYNSQNENIEGYEFSPYLDQMIYYDPHDLTPVPFMNSNTVALVRPAAHVISNYTDFVRLKESLAFKQDEDMVEIFKRPYINPNLRH